MYSLWSKQNENIYVEKNKSTTGELQKTNIACGFQYSSIQGTSKFTERKWQRWTKEIPMA